MKHTTQFALTLSILTLLGGAFVYSHKERISESSQKVRESITIPVEQDGTVLEAMQTYQAHSSFTYTATEYPSLGLFVDSIDDKKNNNNFYWFLYINGTSSPLGASQALVHPGDVVEWRYKQNE